MIRKYIKDTSGNFALITAICLLTIMVGVGAAVDYNSITRQQVKYQSLADAAVLAASTSGETKRSALKKVARKVISEHDVKTKGLRTDLKLIGSDRIQVTIKGKYKTVIMGLFGKKHVPINVLSESILGVHGNINIALVLDVTDSMSDNGKLDALKLAATGMITELQSYSNANISVSIVPFAQYVNVGLHNRNQPWLTVLPDWMEPADPSSCTTDKPIISSTVKPGSCHTYTYPAQPPTSGTPCLRDGVPSLCGGSSGYPAGSGTSCEYDYTYGPEETTCPAPEDHIWNGCVGSRLKPWNKRVANATGKKYPGLLDEECNQAITPLTNDLSKIKLNISNLTTSGDTYSPAGLIWGWRTLDKRQPFKHTNANGEQSRNIIIFMTDGLNSKSLNGELHDLEDRADADKTTNKVCNNIKTANVEIYSLAFELVDVTAKKLVRSCATSTSMFYDANNASELTTAFNNIGNSLVTARLTR